MQEEFDQEELMYHIEHDSSFQCFNLYVNVSTPIDPSEFAKFLRAISHDIEDQVEDGIEDGMFELVDSRVIQ